MRHVGVDGCRSGWLAITRGPSGTLTGRVFQRIEDLVKAFDHAERILIDVPIGLPWPEAPIRPCDRLARVTLGRPRGSSVFSVPCREALSADGLDEAKRTNLRVINRSVGEQTWGISSKIAEVDRFLLAGEPAIRRTIREVHPEICFWALGTKKAMTHSKKTKAGREERIAVIGRLEPGVAGLLDQVSEDYLRRDVEADDILDATIAFITAEARHGELTTLAGMPTHDHEGLPMEMVYLEL